VRTIVLTVPIDALDIASDRLWVAGARAVEERDVGGGVVELRTALASDDTRSLARLGDVPIDWNVRFEHLDDEPAETWREFARPIEVCGGLVIAPAWSEFDAPPDVTVVRIEPGGSFGLGDHPTTRLVAAATHGLVRRGDRVLDVGCGSGVLSIIAATCGAERVVAIDIADAAREATTDNAQRHGVDDRIDVSTTPIGHIDGVFDVVLANVLAPALVGMAPDLKRLTAHDGTLVVSGVLAGGYDHVAAALEPMRPVGAQHLDGWSAVSFEQR